MRDAGPVLALGVGLFLLLTACSSTPLPPRNQWKAETYQEEAGGAGYGGQIVLDTTTTNATVVSVNAADHSLQLKYPNGTLTTYTAGPEVRDFGHIKVGAQVKATRVDETALSLTRTGPLTDVNATNTTIAVPNGNRPELKTVRIRNFIARVLAIDPVGERVTLQMAGGRTKTLRVRDTINLADFSPGDTVSVRSAETTTILVETHE